VAPDYEGLELGIGDSILIASICEATGRSTTSVNASYESEGDLGSVAQVRVVVHIGGDGVAIIIMGGFVVTYMYACVCVCVSVCVSGRGVGLRNGRFSRQSRSRLVGCTSCCARLRWSMVILHETRRRKL